MVTTELQWHPLTIGILSLIGFIIMYAIGAVLKLVFLVKVISPAISLIMVMMSVSIAILGAQYVGTAKDVNIAAIIAPYLVAAIVGILALYLVPKWFPSTLSVLSVFAITGG